MLCVACFLCEAKSQRRDCAKGMSATVDALQEEIHALEEALQDKSRLLAEKKQETGLLTVDVAEAEKAAADAETELAHAQEEFRAAEQERTTLLPQYERCQQNKDQYVKGEEYKRQIAAAEISLKDAEAKIKALEAKLQAVSAVYKTERERKALLVGRVMAQLDELRGAVEEKVMLTVPSDETSDGPDVATSYRTLGVLARERETTIAQCARHARELDATLHLKQQRTTEVRAESDKEIAALKQRKDEQVKNIVLKFEEERQSIQADIDRVRTANADMQRELHNTKVFGDTRGTGAGAVGDGFSRAAERGRGARGVRVRVERLGEQAAAAFYAHAVVWVRLRHRCRGWLKLLSLSPHQHQGEPVSHVLSERLRPTRIPGGNSMPGRPERGGCSRCVAAVDAQNFSLGK